MASFDRDPFGGESFSQLLDSNSSIMGLEVEVDHCVATYSPSFASGNYLSMLCFENHGGDSEKVGIGDMGGASQRRYGTMISGSDSSSGSSSNNNSSSSSTGVATKCKKTQSGEEKRELLRFPVSSDLKAESRKKLKVEKPSSTTGPAKGRKEKIGERITALQQLVSPFGKTDTASVLHEAMGYIRFLHDQVQVLSSPYMQLLPSCHERQNKVGREDGEKEGIIKQDLRSRGLCLVPVSCTARVANSNGADLWSPAMGSTSSKN